LVQVLQLDGSSFRIRQEEMVDPFNLAYGSSIGLKDSRWAGTKLYEPSLLCISQTSPDRKTTDFMYVSGVDPPRRERLDDWQHLQALPLISTHRVWIIGQSRQNGWITPMWDRRHFESQTQSGALGVGSIGKGQIDRGKGEKSRITVCVSDKLQLITAIQR
jgi:hypothetical protein